MQVLAGKPPAAPGVEKVGPAGWRTAAQIGCGSMAGHRPLHGLDAALPNTTWMLPYKARLRAQSNGNRR